MFSFSSQIDEVPSQINALSADIFSQKKPSENDLCAT